MKSLDNDTKRGIANALGRALGLAPTPLLIDAAADAAFANSLERLRGAPGSNKGGKQ